MKQTPGKIFLAEQRGHVQTTHYRRMSTFNYQAYVQEHKTPFGNLYVVNDEMLAGRQRTVHTVEQDTYVLLLPVTGELKVRVSPHGKKLRTDVEQLLVLTLPAGSSFELGNPYEAEVISYLVLWVKASQPVQAVAVQRFHFDFDHIENKLGSIMQPEADSNAPRFPFSLQLGLLEARQEAICYQTFASSSFFVFVLAGAFEVEGRSLQERDGLALWATQAVEVGALSHHALILVLELAS